MLNTKSRRSIGLCYLAGAACLAFWGGRAAAHAGAADATLVSGAEESGELTTVHFEITGADFTSVGDNLVIAGNRPELGNDDPKAGVQLDGSAFPTWRTTVSLPRGATVTFKAYAVFQDGRVEAEDGAPRTYTVPMDGEGQTSFAWRHPANGPSFATDLTPFLKQSCVGADCHSTARQRHGIDLESKEGAQRAYGSALRKMEKGAMPPADSDYPAPSQAEIDQFRRWGQTGFRN